MKLNNHYCDACGREFKGHDSSSYNGAETPYCPFCGPSVLLHEGLKIKKEKTDKGINGKL